MYVERSEHDDELSQELRDFKSLCPYWKKVFHLTGRGKTLVLCGAEETTQLTYPDFPDAPKRLLKCPWHDFVTAYTEPAILEIPAADWLPEGIDDSHSVVRHSNKLEGKKGVAYLEEVWEEEVRAFIERNK